MKPLEGIRVVELARVLAGPWCGQLLADLGAGVVKVERPGAGDDTRSWGPPFVMGAGGAESRALPIITAANRGKAGAAIDIATAEGRPRFARLIADADVVIENYKVGGLAKYGLDPATLRADFPRLIVCSITGFGQTGPYAHRAGYDFIIQAMGGAMSLTGEPDGAPQKARIAYADIFTGMYSTVAILAALRRRDVTGQGAHIDMALLDCQVGVLANQAANYLASGVSPRRMGNGARQCGALSGVRDRRRPAGDRGRQRRPVSQIMCDPRRTRLGRRPALCDQRGAARRSRRADPAARGEDRDMGCAAPVAGARGRGVPAGPISDIAAVFSDPQVEARGMRFRPDGASVDGLASPIVIDGERMVARTAAPPLGVSMGLYFKGASPWTPFPLFGDAVRSEFDRAGDEHPCRVAIESGLHAFEAQRRAARRVLIIIARRDILLVGQILAVDADRIIAAVGGPHEARIPQHMPGWSSAGIGTSN